MSQSLPSLPERAARFSWELVRTAGIFLRGKQVKVDEFTAQARWAACSSCKFLVQTSHKDFCCSHCGCHLQRAIWWASKRCPMNKWHFGQDNHGQAINSRR